MGARRARHGGGAGQKGGEKLGRSSVDRSKAGSRHHLVTDGRGTPLALRLAPGNRHDSVAFEVMLDAIPPIRRPRGRPRRRPHKLHADKAYDAARCRTACRRRGIVPRIARRGIDSSAHLGKHRWVVERTFAWLYRFRRLVIRYERRADIHEGFLSLACALLCWKAIERFC